MEVMGHIESNRAKAFDNIIMTLLVSLLAFMPIALGASRPWSEQVVIFLSGAIVTCFCLKTTICPEQRIIWSWTYIPIALFIFIAAFGLIDLPRRLVEIISPNTVILKDKLLSDISNSGNTEFMSISFYRAAGIHDLRFVLAAAGIFFVVINTFRKPEQIKKLLTVIVIIGSTIAFITIGQNLAGNGKIYWLISTPNSQGYSGPFVNHSHYGQFMNLVIGASLALLLIKLHERFTGEGVTTSAVFDFLGSHSSRKIWALIGLIAICITTVFISLTRGGIISMLLAGAFSALILAKSKAIKGHGWLFTVITLFAFCCILYVGFDAVCNRLATLRNLQQENSSRIQILKDIAVAWKQFPLLGTGLGTHKYVYPMFDRSHIVALATHAENEYAQVLEETGSLGLIALVTLGVMVWRSYFKAIKTQKHPLNVGVFGLGFGLLAILIHSMTDFGQHIPANGLLTTIFCGLIIVLANYSKEALRTRKPEHYRGRMILRLVVFVIISVIWVQAVRDFNNDRIAQQSWSKAVDVEKRLEAKNWDATEQEYTELIRHSQEAVKKSPDNIHYQYWANIYRWYSLGGNMDPYTGEIAVNDKNIPAVKDIISNLEEICKICPSYGPAYGSAGQIKLFCLEDDSGIELIRKSYFLYPNNPSICLLAGYLDAWEGKIYPAKEKFARAIKLDPRLFANVSKIYIDYLSRPELCIEAAGESSWDLYYVLKALRDSQYPDYSSHAQDKLIKVIENKCDKNMASAWERRILGICYKNKNQTEAAIECYREALRLKYEQVDWRYELAVLLVENNLFKEAMRETRICLQLRPEFMEAKNLLAHCSVQKSVLIEAIEQ